MSLAYPLNSKHNQIEQWTCQNLTQHYTFFKSKYCMLSLSSIHYCQRNYYTACPHIHFKIVLISQTIFSLVPMRWLTIHAPYWDQFVPRLFLQHSVTNAEKHDTIPLCMGSGCCTRQMTTPTMQTGTGRVKVGGEAAKR